MMSCKEATLLMSQNLDRRLGLMERIGLRLHVLICIGCRNTQQHFEFLRQLARRSGTP
jgi:hypothetical protein